jgi:cytochrome b561
MTQQRYTSVAIVLHWIMALSFLLMLGSGLIMTDLEDRALQFQMYQWHKSLGVLLLLAFFARIGWRLFHRPPALPGDMKPLEKKAARAGHYGLYALMILIPLSGWIMVSASIYGLPTIVFGLFEWPHVPGISSSETISETFEEVHEILAYLFMAMIAVHIAAVAKHYLVDKENLLNRMWWTKKTTPAQSLEKQA